MVTPNSPAGRTSEVVIADLSPCFNPVRSPGQRLHLAEAFAVQDLLGIPIDTRRAGR